MNSYVYAVDHGSVEQAWGVLAVFVGLWVFAVLIGLAISVLVYVLQGIGLYKMTKNTGGSHAWCAWVPVAHQYQVGYLADRYRRLTGKNTKYGFWILLLYLISVVGAIAVVATFFLMMASGEAWVVLLWFLSYLVCFGSDIALVVVYCIASYWMYRDYEPSNAVVYTVLAVFGLDFIAKFLCRSNVPVGIAGRVQPKQPKYGVPGSPVSQPVKPVEPMPPRQPMSPPAQYLSPSASVPPVKPVEPVPPLATPEQPPEPQAGFVPIDLEKPQEDMPQGETGSQENSQPSQDGEDEKQR